MSVSRWNILCPYIFVRSEIERGKKDIYLILKDYIKIRLDIKDILKTSNELDKLKIFTIDEETKILMASKFNPFPESEDSESIWENYNVEKFKSL